MIEPAEDPPPTTTVSGPAMAGPLYLIRMATAPPVHAPPAAGAMQAVLVTSNSQAAQSTLAVSVHCEPFLSQALSPRAHVALVIVAVSVPLTLKQIPVPPEQLPTAASVGINLQLWAPCATVPKSRVPPGPPVSLTITPLTSSSPVLDTQ